MELLRTENLSHRVANRTILESINLVLRPGEVLGIVGRSGAGKSTLLKLFAGLLDVQTGNVFFDGKKLIGPSEKLIPGYEDIQLVNQEFDLDPYHTVAENIRIKLLHFSRNERDAFVDELLELTGLQAIRDSKAHLISGGEKQRLALARALAHEPRVLLLDEPFSHLDSHLHERISSYLQELRRVRDTSIVLVAHDSRDVFALCDKVCYLKKGKIVRKATPEVFYRKPKSREEALFFGEVNQIRAGGKSYLFRPDAYRLKAFESSVPLDVEFIGAQFRPPVYHNFFKLPDGKQIILYNFEKLNGTQKIFIASGDQEINVAGDRGGH